MKNTITITLLSIILSFSSAYSQEIGKYAVSVGISPFGGGINLSHNMNERTSVNIGFGGAPEGDIPDAIKPEIDGFSDNYTHTAKSAWMGIFVSHQPLDQFNWLRVNAGFAVGSIENTILDGNEAYYADYNENPVSYFGLNIGKPPYKGLVYGLDIGALFSSGADFSHNVNGDLDKYNALQDGVPGLTNVLPNFQLTVGYCF